MTNEELERAIDFMLKSQANLEAQSARTDERLRQLTEQVSSFADTQANVMRVMTVTFEAQNRINESLRASDESLRSAMTELATRQSRTEEALTRLAERMAGTDRRLEALIKIVGEGRGSQ